MSGQEYPRYKPSGMEWLGDEHGHWEVRKVKHVASVQFSNIDKHTDEGQDPVRLCKHTDVCRHDFINESFEPMMETATSSEIARFQVHQREALTAKDSESRDDTAVPAYVSADLDGVLCGCHLAQIRPGFQRIHGFRAFCSSAVNPQLRIAATGSTPLELGKYWLDRRMFPAARKAEQAEIMATLSAAWNDLLLDGGSLTDTEIINKVLTSWHESRERFKAPRLQRTLEWMRKKNLVPVGHGKKAESVSKRDVSREAAW